MDSKSLYRTRASREGAYMHGGWLGSLVGLLARACTYRGYRMRRYGTGQVRRTRLHGAAKGQGLAAFPYVGARARLSND